MGNCINRQRVATWVDDDEDWDSVFQDEEKEKATGVSSGEQVKIKITKKQLDQFLQKGMSMEQVLAQILNNGYVRTPNEQQQQHWRPALNSIAE